MYQLSFINAENVTVSTRNTEYETEYGALLDGVREVFVGCKLGVCVENLETGICRCVANKEIRAALDVADGNTRTAMVALQAEKTHVAANLLYGDDPIVKHRAADERDAPTKADSYERFKLQWMLDHGYTLEDLMRELTNLQYDPPADIEQISTPVHKLFEEWEMDSGFGSEIWPCEAEWAECEGQEPSKPIAEPDRCTFRTPVGNVCVTVKGTQDDYPGVYVELTGKDGVKDLLACVEFDSSKEKILTTVYDAGEDEPQVVHYHQMEGEK